MLAPTLLTGGLLAGLLVGVISGGGRGSAHGLDRSPNTSTRVAATAPSVSRARTVREAAAAGTSGHTSAMRAGTPWVTGATSSGTGTVNGPSRKAADTNRTKLQVALDRGVDGADELGGETAAAVWVAGDRQPILSGPVRVPHRMWSMSKAVVAVAALQAMGGKPEPVLRSALADAIRRSDNCAIRRVIVGLQDRLKAGVSGTVAAFERVLRRGGARIETTPQAAAAEQACVRYLDRHRGGLPGGDLGVVPQFGTAQWTEVDAISFAHALAEGAYGIPGSYLLRLMEQPKEPPLEEPPPPLAPPLDWGAGSVFPSAWRPAWKAGWGGSQDSPPHFLAGQIVSLQLARTRVAVAALFAPKAQPATDNPGLTRAPLALERVFDAVRTGLEAERMDYG